MFQHILVPTDGSPLSEAAAARAIAFAREIGAHVTGLSVKPRFHPFTLRPEQVEDTKADRWDVDLHARFEEVDIDDAGRISTGPAYLMSGPCRPGLPAVGNGDGDRRRHGAQAPSQAQK